MKETICAIALSTAFLSGCADRIVGKTGVEYTVSKEVIVTKNFTFFKDVPMRTNGKAIMDEDGLLLCEVYADVDNNGRYNPKIDISMGFYYCSLL
ncbi:MAG: hypothetical protein KKA62_02325 [Nanoarchaeota archaeon]|nr:hypothetical protein [Nanoarchaeota archaeon]MBU1643671.1 hypothetical protein [Nanoarchaeota archaeon]MBU1976769.1 hypothetical protein [Nanoarchaeota archaeon]